MKLYSATEQKDVSFHQVRRSDGSGASIGSAGDYSWPGAQGTWWQDGPLTRAVREGGICYLDEVVEARQDTAVVLHPLADDRRQLYLERTGEVLQAPPSFMLVVSYNPGYQNILKKLQASNRLEAVVKWFQAGGVADPAEDLQPAVPDHP